MHTSWVPYRESHCTLRAEPACNLMKCAIGKGRAVRPESPLPTALHGLREKGEGVLDLGARHLLFDEESIPRGQACGDTTFLGSLRIRNRGFRV